MITKKMASALNDQINAELYSSYLYLSMSAYAAAEGMNGVANWLFVQAQEEATHAQMFYHYILRVGEKVVLEAIEKPPVSFKGVVDIFTKVLEHERKVTKRIHKLVSLAREAGDPATEVFLQWFVTEQVEEEENAGNLLAQMKMAEGAPGAIFMIDKDLAARVFTPPAPAA